MPFDSCDRWDLTFSLDLVADDLSEDPFTLPTVPATYFHYMPAFLKLLADLPLNDESLLLSRILLAVLLLVSEGAEPTYPFEL